MTRPALATAACALVAVAAAGCGTKTTTKTVTVVPTGTIAGSTSASTEVAAGAHDFVQFACAQCHGIGGRGGVSPDVPALKQVGPHLTVAQLTRIIDHGLGESSNPTKPYMPVWGEVISAQQVRTSSPTCAPGSRPCRQRWRRRS